jgi:GNAT superfamily N-acetyltransferase
MRDDWNKDTNRFDGEGEFLLAASAGEQILGVCGVNKDPYVAGSNIGRIRHLYVRPDSRQLGIGKALVHAAVSRAWPRFSVLRLRTDSKTAAEFYERLGWTKVESEVSATHVYEIKPP